ncbi:MAG: 50S ribosomal protein L23 [Spirochaetia bacterium]|nr:50S ribosomal protein L23 [Spirochaetota bacterium]MCX8096098.1 50S ribosomal protein L23 [Spirochaetota bacterium]MDW8113111.1 50S ribosomal protein L23 [Spirochaetia bacterium]
MSKSIILSPVISEKSQSLMFDEKNNPTGFYVFKVVRSATKMQIKQEIERLYKVEVESVNTYVVPRKKRMIRGRVGYTSGWKKAFIKLSKGVIPIFEEVSAPQEEKKETKQDKKEVKKEEKSSKKK